MLGGYATTFVLSYFFLLAHLLSKTTMQQATLGNYILFSKPV